MIHEKHLSGYIRESGTMELGLDAHYTLITALYNVVCVLQVIDKIVGL
jgi:hypothetical protein